ncbi:hypothetical protein ACLOEZ_04790 [Levilactobacillus brevis]|uniref:hypothetical protein n=1 Tax=Levilactobacillus brevis TaxID=1580 RepID=UPI003EBE507D
MNFDNFKALDLTKGPNAITFSKNGLSFSQTAINSLGRPRFVKLLVNSDEQQIAVQTVDESDKDAIPFYKDSRKNLVVRWNYSGLNSLLSQMMDWNAEENTYKVVGELHAEDNALLFELKDAEVTKRR